MPSTILSDNGVSSGSAGLKTTASNDGILALQTTTSGGTATTAVTIDTAQNVGVGVTPSAWASSYKALDVGNTASFYFDSSGAVVSNNSFINSSFQYRYKTSNAATRYEQTSAGQHQWYTAASGTAGNAITFTQAMTLDASGNLGIGHTATSSYGRFSYSSNSGTTVVGGYTDSSIGWFGTGTSHALAFGTAGTERARIDTSGNLLVGSTTINVISSNVAGCTIWGGANAGEFMAAKAGASLELSRLSTTGGIAYFYYNNSNVAGYISVNSASTVGYNQGSDERLKKNIVDSSPALDHVLSMRVRAFDWKSDDLHWDYGFIAQELKQIAPYAVYSPENPDEMMGIDFSKLVPALTKAIQEQQAIIAQLQADVAALKGTP